MSVRLVVMGVSGCGKSTVGQMIADSLHLSFLDGDDFHPASNIEKMASGTALNDDDRQPWLEELAHQLQSHKDGCVIAYDDETLQELWRFNVGTPLKGAPVTYAIGPKQYVAVQTSGRHLHPVNYDGLENSSYLFVFALDD